MKTIEITTNVKVYENLSELPIDLRKLMEAAKDARQLAYAPYSDFRVGAAVALEDGRILSGANQENAAYPMCMCAERVALGNANMEAPQMAITAMAISVHNPRKKISAPATPCGACRQVICEQEGRQEQAIPLLLQGAEGPVYFIESGRDLLPLSFDKSFL
ncbi:MAG TPA: cytidine deaminase [Phaeodactylibacter sp.]|nr:cytidine deaminase [Phaeodactylibacter sp.]